MATPPDRRIFRQAALDRLSSPEQLDQLVVVADPVGWLAAGTVTALLAAILVWGIWGKIPDQVNGKGILVSSEGRVLDAMSPAAGTIAGLGGSLITQTAGLDAGLVVGDGVGGLLTGLEGLQPLYQAVVHGCRAAVRHLRDRGALHL